MDYQKTNQYDKQFIQENMMGPNSLKIIEEATAKLGPKLKPHMRVMDLGCGKGLTSIFLAKEYDVNVYATDLWISATENYQRFKELGLDQQIVPIHADVMDLPYAEDYFDAIFSVDAYHYFGRTAQFRDENLAKFVKPGGLICLAFPGFHEEIHRNLPDEIFLSWAREDMEAFHSCQWWHDLLSQSSMIQVESVTEMDCFEEAWKDWLNTDIEYAINDRKAMEAGAKKCMNIILVIASREI